MIASGLVFAVMFGFRFGWLDDWLVRVLFLVMQVNLQTSVGLVLQGGRGREKAKAGFVARRGGALVITCGRKEQPIALDQLRQGWLEDVFGEGDACDVVLCLRDGREVTVRVADRATGEALLLKAGVSAASRVLHFPLRSLAASQRYGEILGTFSMAVLVPMLLGVAIAAPLQPYIEALRSASSLGELRYLGLLLAICASTALAMLGFYRLLRRRAVIVGADGVALERFGKRRFIAYTEVRRLGRDPEGVRLHLNDGESVLLPTIIDTSAPLPVTRGVDAQFDPATVKRTLPRGLASEAVYEKDMARREALFNRIKQARRGRGQSRVSSVQLAQLDRQSRSLPAWRDDLRALLAVEGSGYRRAALGSDQLADVVEDAAAPTERRIAAAIALSGNGDTESRRRVRVAVEGCADEDLRAALAQAAEGEIEEPKLQRAMKRRGELG